METIKSLPQMHPSNHVNLNLMLKISTIILLMIVLFLQDFLYVFENAFQNINAVFFLFLPLFFIYLVHRKWKMLASVISIDNSDQHTRIKYLLTTTRILTPAIAFVLYWHGSLTSLPIAYHFLALPIFLTGLILLFFNYQTLRQLLFPIAILFFFTPLSFGALQILADAISGQALQFSLSITHLISLSSPLISAQHAVNGISTSTYTMLHISATYSTANNVLIFLLFAMLSAYMTRGKALKKIGVVILQIPLIYLFDSVNSTTLLLANYYTLEGLVVHFLVLLEGGFFIFVGIIGLPKLKGKSSKSPTFLKKIQSNLQNASEIKFYPYISNPIGKIQTLKNDSGNKIDSLKIIAAALAIIVLLSIQTPTFAVTPSPSITLTDTATGQQVSANILPNILNYSLLIVQRDTETEKNFNVDMALVCLYTPENEALEPVWVSIEIASSRSSLPPWNETLINLPIRQGKKPEADLIDTMDIQLSKKPETISSYLAFRYLKTNQSEAVLYWYESAMFRINSTIQHKYVELSLIVYPKDDQSLSYAGNALLLFADAIINYWQPILPWSAMAGLIGDYGLYIVAGMLFVLLLITTVLYRLEYLEQRRKSRTVYSKLSKQNQRFIDAIIELERKGNPTMNEIAESYQKETGQHIEKDQLVLELMKMKKLGIIRNVVINKDDELESAWKTTLS
jgi:hypothetical protein